MKFILFLFLGLILLIAATLFLRIKFEIVLNDSVYLKLNILGLKFTLYPEKKKKISVNKFKKGYPKQQKKETPPEKITKKSPTAQDDNVSIGDKLSTVINLIKQLISRLSKHLRLDISNIIVIVGGKNPAEIAIAYGIISQSVAYLLAFLDSNISVRKNKTSTINVACDFTSEKIAYDVFISLSLNIWQIIDIIISLVYNYFNGIDILNIKGKFNIGENDNGRK